MSLRGQRIRPPKAPSPSSPGEDTLQSYRVACGENPGFVEWRFVIACVRPEYAERGSDFEVSSFTPLPRRLPREQAEALFLPYLGSNTWIVLRRDFSSRIISNWRIGAGSHFGQWRPSGGRVGRGAARGTGAADQNFASVDPCFPAAAGAFGRRIHAGHDHASHPGGGNDRDDPVAHR